jgi:aminoglycoside phosphotransferase (APT) family kinase protein
MQLKLLISTRKKAGKRMEAEPLPVDIDTIELHLKQLLALLLGSRVEIIKLISANQRVDYRVLILKLAKPALTLVVKLAGPNAPYPCPFERTASLHHLVKAKTKIPMPEVLAADTSCSRFPWRYMVKTFMPGQQWVDILPGLNFEQRVSVYKQFGAAVSELHTIDFSGFGSLEDDASLQKQQPLLSALTERARVFIHEPRLLKLFLETLQQHQDWFADVNRASLVHEDLHGYNILFDHRDGCWQLSTLLDFDKAWAGHHEVDLARLDLWTGMTTPAFWQAYNERQPLDPLFHQRKLLYQLQWCFEFPHKDSAHLELTRRVACALGLKPISF